MDDDKYNLYVVAGPTASGKTDTAIKLAQELNGELINADSRQIYKYLDIGTNKGELSLIEDGEYPVFEIENSSIPIHLLSFLDPDQRFSAHNYQQAVYELIPQIWDKGKVPILVGGTGLYIDVVLHPEKYEWTADSEQGLSSDLTVEELQEMVNPHDLAAMNDSDRNNPRRLVRMIQKQNQSPGVAFEPDVEINAQVFYIEPEIDELEAKINTRVLEMFEQGLIQEVESILTKGFLRDSVALQGIGYREVLQLLDGEIDQKECIRLIQIAHRQYAKRQMTWFGKYL